MCFQLTMFPVNKIFVLGRKLNMDPILVTTESRLDMATFRDLVAAHPRLFDVVNLLFCRDDVARATSDYVLKNGLYMGMGLKGYEYVDRLKTHHATMEDIYAILRKANRSVNIRELKQLSGTTIDETTFRDACNEHYGVWVRLEEAMKNQSARNAVCFYMASLGTIGDPGSASECVQILDKTHATMEDVYEILENAGDEKAVADIKALRTRPIEKKPQVAAAGISPGMVDAMNARNAILSRVVKTESARVTFDTPTPAPPPMALLYRAIDNNVPLGMAIANKLQELHSRGLLSNWYTALSQVSSGKYTGVFTGSFYSNITNSADYRDVGRNMLQSVANAGVTVEELAIAFEKSGNAVTAEMVRTGIVRDSTSMPTAFTPVSASPAVLYTMPPPAASMDTDDLDIGDDTDDNKPWIPQWTAAAMMGGVATHVSGFVNKGKFIEDQLIANKTFDRMVGLAKYREAECVLLAALNVYRGGQVSATRQTTSHADIEEDLDLGSDEEAPKFRAKRTVTLTAPRTATASKPTTFSVGGVEHQIKEDTQFGQFVIMEIAIAGHKILDNLILPADSELTTAQRTATMLSKKNKASDYVVYGVIRSTVTLDTAVDSSSLASVKVKSPKTPPSSKLRPTGKAEKPSASAKTKPAKSSSEEVEFADAGSDMEAQ